MRSTGITLEEHLSSYTTDSFVHACVSQVGFIYCCIPEYRLSAGEFARCLKWESEARSSAYPTGGCVAITDAYLAGLGRTAWTCTSACRWRRCWWRTAKPWASSRAARSPRRLCRVEFQHQRYRARAGGAEHFDEEYVRYVERSGHFVRGHHRSLRHGHAGQPRDQDARDFSSMVPREGVQRDACARRDARRDQRVHRGARQASTPQWRPRASSLS